ncbi:S8 family serine peptidase [Dactylosporangium sp. CA-233914]|uniref:S8 family serine peptidase n=1 Tax=Dactylosporangium sp. CA-233914 TaxID=3239934 RepID=UPI003D8B13C1
MARNTPPRLQRAALGAVAATLLAVAASPPASAANADVSSGVWRDVVVTGGSADAAAVAVSTAGGAVLASLPVVDGVAARLPVGAELSREWVVVPQRVLRVASVSATAGGAPVSTVRKTLGLPANGNEGAGVTVAVVDTGIADVPDLSGKVKSRVDVTGTGAGDGFGHGTFMAGLIAGSGTASGGAYRGVAPGAKLVDVKVADAQGRTDLITVLRGLQWVSEHAREVQVLNLSLSSYSPLPYQIDPLTQGLEALWRRGVTVVVPSGNDGPNAGTVTSPGNDPVLLTAGGLDESSTANRADDVVGTWSGRGPTWQADAKPDLVAPGGHVVSLRSPGSVADTSNPQARIVNGYFRGSGTSMATAVTAGVVAAAIAVQPKLRPDAVKNLLTATTYAAPGLTRSGGAGAGGLDAARVLAAAAGWPASKAAAQYDRDTEAIVRDANGWMALEQALLNRDGAAATNAWNKLSPASRDWAARSWAQLDPAARSWAAQSWTARSWAGAGSEWTARSWAARSWAARSWASDAWTARSWAGADWTARSWAARSWAESDWAARSWAGDGWAARSWATDRWSAGSWSWLLQP